MTVFSGANKDYVNDGRIDDGVLIDGTAIRLTNSQSGRVFGGVVFAQGGHSFVNESGGIVHLAENDLPDAVVITGSDGSDTIVNGGRITGGIFLGGGADLFTWQSNASIAGLVDLGDGDDVFRLNDSNGSGTIEGGAGYDRFELLGGWSYFLAATGFEALHFAASGLVSGASGLQAITYAANANVEFANSYSPAGVVTLNGGEFQLGVDGIVGLIEGTAERDAIRLSLHSGFDQALLGAGDDAISTAAVTLSRQAGSPVGTVADGGDGWDRISLGVADGTPDVTEHYDVELSKFENFEELTFDSAIRQFDGTLTTSDIAIVGATAAQRFSHLITGNDNHVAIDVSNDAAAFGSAIVNIGDRATLLVGGNGAANAVIGSVTTATTGFSDGPEADDTRSVTVVNNGSVLGNIAFGIGDDFYDGSVGNLAGTVFGNAGNDTLIGGVSAERFEGGYGGDELRGNGGNDQLFGGAGNDVLDGGAGADSLAGGTGNDSYYIDAGDTVTELAGEGTDTVYVRGSYTIAAGVSIDVVQTYGSSTTYAADLTGNEIANILVGNAAANRIDGGTGRDVMYGYGGGDIYFVDNSGDVVREAAGGGNDTVVATANFALGAGSEVETIRTTGSTSTYAVNLSGNELANAIAGNAAANVIDGGGGADVMYGYGGNDSYYVNDARDMVVESAGGGHDAVYTTTSYTLVAGSAVEELRTLGSSTGYAADLTGNELANALVGNAAANTLHGGGGADSLWGYGGNDMLFGDEGADTFVITAGFGKDTIADFGTSGTGDSVRFLAGTFSSFADLMSHAAQQGSDVVFTLDANNSVTLQNTQLAMLSAQSFTFG